MKKKNILWLVLTLLVVPMLLVACGGGDTPVEEEETTTEEDPIEEEMEEEEPMDEEMDMEEDEEMDMTDEEMDMMVDPSGQTITFWHAMSSGRNLEGIENLVAEFNATNEYGITVEQFAQGGQGDLAGALNGAVATGELPNLTQGFPNSLATLNNLGFITPLNHFIADPDHGWSNETLDDIFPGPYSQGTLPDGTQIGVAMHQSIGMLFYNHTWAQELGFAAPPATSAEFEEQACAAAAANNADDNPDNDGTGGYVYFPDASYVAPWVWAFGGEIINEAGDAYSLNNEAILGAAMLMKNLYDGGCTLSTPSFPNPEFASRLALFYSGSSAGIPFQRSDMEAAGSTDVWGPIPFPGPDGTLVVNAFGQMVGIITTNPEADLASWLFLSWLVSPETQGSWVSQTSYFPSQGATDTSSAEEDPIWAEAYDLLSIAKGEPNLAAHGSVRGAIRDAFFALIEADDEAGVQAILDELNDTAAELVAESQ